MKRSQFGWFKICSKPTAMSLLHNSFYIYIIYIVRLPSAEREKIILGPKYSIWNSKPMRDVDYESVQNTALLRAFCLLRIQGSIVLLNGGEWFCQLCGCALRPLRKTELMGKLITSNYINLIWQLANNFNSPWRAKKEHKLEFLTLSLTDFSFLC